MIKGEKIILRTIRKRDLEEFLDLSSNLENMGAFWPTKIRTEATLNKEYQNENLWTEDKGLMLITNLKGKIIGEISYFKGVWYLPGYEISFNIFKKEETDENHIIEALDLFSNYLFELWPIQRLEITVSEINEFNRNIIKKCGYKLEGVKRDSLFQKGKYNNLELYSLIRGEERPYQEPQPS